MPKRRVPRIALCLAVCLGCASAASAQTAPAARGGRLAVPENAPFPPPASLCYAFLGGARFTHYGDDYRTIPVQVWVSCGSYLGPVTLGGQAWAFAVSPARMVVALASKAGAVRAFSLRHPYRGLLWRGPQGESVANWGLQPTCGTIAVWSSARSATIDGLSGVAISGLGGGFLACGDSRSAVVGIPAAQLNAVGGAAPWLQMDGKYLTQTAIDFAISPGGRQLAWISRAGGNGRWPACVSGVGPGLPSVACTPACEVGWGASSDASLDSVTDYGAIVFGASSWSNGCPWCSSIYYWRPTDPPRLPVLLQRSGAQPQWITPAAARGLIARYRYLLAHRPEKREP